MGMVVLSNSESFNASKLALRHMATPKGVITVNVDLKYLPVQTSPIDGVAMAYASINQSFIDNIINKEHEEFKKGKQLFDDYKKYYTKPGSKKDSVIRDRDRNWTIKITKETSFFSSKYLAGSWLCLGNYQYCIDYKTDFKSLESVFEYLCYSKAKIPN